MTTEQVKEMQEVKSRSESNSHRIDKLEDSMHELKEEHKVIYDLGASVKVLADNMTDMKTDMREVKHNCVDLNNKLDSDMAAMKEEVDAVKNQPLKAKSDWFDKVAWLIVGGIGTAILGYIIDMVMK